MYTYTHIHTYIHTYMYIHVHTIRTYVCILYVCTHVYTYDQNYWVVNDILMKITLADSYPVDNLIDNLITEAYDLQKIQY